MFSVVSSWQLSARCGAASALLCDFTPRLGTLRPAPSIISLKQYYNDETSSLSLSLCWTETQSSSHRLRVFQLLTDYHRRSDVAMTSQRRQQTPVVLMTSRWRHTDDDGDDGLYKDSSTESCSAAVCYRAAMCAHHRLYVVVSHYLLFVYLKLTTDGPEGHLYRRR